MKRFKNFLKKTIFILLILPILFILFDFSNFDSSYLNRSWVNFDIKNQNSRHTMKISNELRYFYLKIYKKINPKSFDERWGIENGKDRNNLKEEIKIYPKKNNFNAPLYTEDKYNIEKEWFKSHGNYFSTRFSSLDQINISNINKLKLAWVYKTPILSKRFTMNVQANPVVYKNLVISPNPENQIVAINGLNGKEIWNYQIKKGIAAKRGFVIFDPKTINEKKYKNTNPWIFFTNNRHELFALDIMSGKAIKSFGKNGIIKTGLSPMPPIIYKDNLILVTTKSIIESYNVVTGKINWKFKINKTKNSLIFQNFRKGSPWGGISLDKKRGLIFLNTGNPEHDHIGTDRPGSNLYSNSIICFDLNKKKIKWYFQETPHDLWNMDIASTPILTMIKKNNKFTDVVVSISKTGNVIILDRESGENFFEYKKIKAPTSDVPGERTSVYQIKFSNIEKVCRNNFKNSYLSNLPYVNKKMLEEKIKGAHYGFPIPPKLSNKMVHLEGCVRWAGGSIDTKNNILYVSTDQEPVLVSIIKDKYWRGHYSYKLEPFRDEKGYPAIKPPWGAIVAYNLSTGKIIWKVPFGEWDDLKNINIMKTGTKNRAGITASSGGLIFASGTWDNKFTVVDSKDGKTVWEYKMTAPGSAPPTIYSLKNKQYIVVPAFEKRGRNIYAFTLE